MSNLTYLTGEMSNGSAKLRDTYPRGIGRCFVERPIDPFDGEPWFLDNGAFIEWNRNGRDIHCDYTARFEHFESRLPRAAELAREGRGPMFIVVPDRPGHPDSLATSQGWIDRWYDELQPELGVDLPLYLALQDGMTPASVEGTLPYVRGLFLGGTDGFKGTVNIWRDVADDWGLQLHYARCTQSRLRLAVDAGCDSADSAHPIRLAGRRWQRFLNVYDEVVGGGPA